jgi:hypothetical protein
MPAAPLRDPFEQLLTVDSNGRGTIQTLSRAANDHHGGSPLERAASELSSIAPGGVVLINVGFIEPPSLTQETDGPIGAASLARALKTGFDLHPIVLAEERGLPVVKAALRAFGLNVSNTAEAKTASWTAGLEAFPAEADRADEAARALLDSHDVAALVALEKAGANREGEYHHMTGQNWTAHCAKTDVLFEASNAVTIGIGDGGNELGMGTIRHEIQDEIPNGTACDCGCGGGIVSDTQTDVVVPVTVSNWGAHGIVLHLSLEAGENLLHPPELESRALVRCGSEGSIDGETGRTDGYCDALSPATHASIVRVLSDMVDNRIEG